MNEADLLHAIRDELDGVEWTADTTAAIAQLMIDNGFPIRDLDGDRITDDATSRIAPNIPCVACGRSDLPLHSNGRCGECGIDTPNATVASGNGWRYRVTEEPTINTNGLCFAIIEETPDNPDGEEIAVLWSGECADSIVKILNARDNLVAACRLALALVKDTWVEEHGSESVGRTWAALESALAKAGAT